MSLIYFQYPTYWSPCIYYTHSYVSNECWWASKGYLQQCG